MGMKTPAVKMAKPASAGLASRAMYLQRRREATRAAILDAARQVFAEASYIQAKIDDIIRTAGVSRATFYAHFESKRELAYAIYEAIAPQTDALFARLPGLAEQDLTAARVWLSDFVGIYIEHRYVTPLIAQLQLFENSFRLRILADTEKLMDRLHSAGVSRFAREKLDSRVSRERARGRLLLNEVAAVCGDIARGELSDVEADMCLDLLGEKLLLFLRE